MRTSHKLTRLVLGLVSLTALTTSLFAQVFNNNGNLAAPGAVVVPPGNSTAATVYPGANFPSPQPPGFRGNWNNENQPSILGGTPAGAIVDPPAQVQVSDQKPGSMLVYPYYTSNLATGGNTWVTISNSSDRYAVLVHIFFIEGTNCTQADQFICLTPNASLQMKASDFDPDVRRGWVLAVAVNAQGKPAQRNFLMGNAFVSDGAAVGNYGAESFTAYTNNATANLAGVNAAVNFPVLPAPAISGDPACRYDSVTPFTSLNGYNANGYIPGLFDDNVTTAGLNLTGPPTFCSARDFNVVNQGLGPNTDIRTFQLNGGGYDFAPNRFSIEIQSPVDVAGQQIITVGLNGDLNAATLTGSAQVGTGVVINGNETPFGSFFGFLTGRCQSVGTIDNTTPRVPRGLGALIPSGNVGTMAFNVNAAVGIIITPRVATKATSGIRTLHKTNVNAARVTSGNVPVTIAGVAQVPALQFTGTRRFGVQLTIPVYIPPSCGTVPVAQNGNIID